MATATELQNARKRTVAIKTAAPVLQTPPVIAAPPTKQSQLLALLRRDGGASIAELVCALGWLPHTTRAALTGLRKKGHDVMKSKVDDVTRYSIAAANAEG